MLSTDRLARGAKLRERRRALGLAQTVVAFAANVHPNSVAAAERGQASDEVMARIAAALSVAGEAQP